MHTIAMVLTLAAVTSLIAPDHSLDLVEVTPLPPLDARDTAGKDIHTANVAGSGFAFGARPGLIIFYPAYAQDSFTPNGPAPTGGFHP